MFKMKIRNKITALVALLMVSGLAMSQDFSVSPTGIQYKIFPGGGTKTIQHGKILRLSMIVKLNDSVVYTTYGKVPAYQLVDSAMGWHNIQETLQMMKEGDSAVCIQMADSLIKKFGDNMSNVLKPGDKIYNYFKVVTVFPDEPTAMKDYENEQKLMQASEIATLENYLKKNNITAQMAEGGTFVEIIEPGTSPAVDSGATIGVKYTGRTFAGVVFDSNTDSAFNHVQVFEFAVGQGSVISGWDKGLRLLKKGAKARLYIPSTEGYGMAGNGGEIKPYDNLIFDVEIVSVKPPVKKTATPAKKPLAKKPLPKKKPAAKKPLPKKTVKKS